MAKLLLVLAFGVLIFGTNSFSSAICAGFGYELLVAKLEILADIVLHGQMKSKEQVESLLQNQILIKQHQQNMEKKILEGQMKTEQVNLLLQNQQNMEKKILDLQVQEKVQTELQRQNQNLIKQHQLYLENKILEGKMNFTQMKEQMESLFQNPNVVKQQISNVSTSVTSCRQQNPKKSGRFWLSGAGFEVYCEQELYDGGWIVIMKRLPYSSNFQRTWADYKKGFGDLDGEFWLGLDNIHQLTLSKAYEIVIHIDDRDSAVDYFQFSEFAIGSEDDDYAVNTLGEYNGTVSFRRSYLPLRKGLKFSTEDKDNDNHKDNSCASKFHIGWWYGTCAG